MSENIFRFKKNDQIGAAGAEEDLDYLLPCYVNTGDIDLLQDTADRRQIVLGRTGTGKSALLIKGYIRNSQRMNITSSLAI